MFFAYVPAGTGFPGVPGPPITAPPQTRSRVVESRSRFSSTSGRLFTVVDGNRAVVGLRGMMVYGYGRTAVDFYPRLRGMATMGQPRGSQSRGRFVRRRERLRQIHVGAQNTFRLVRP